MSFQHRETCPNSHWIPCAVSQLCSRAVHFNSPVPALNSQVVNNRSFTLMGVWSAFYSNKHTLELCSGHVLNTLQTHTLFYRLCSPERYIARPAGLCLSGERVLLFPILFFIALIKACVCCVGRQNFMKITEDRLDHTKAHGGSYEALQLQLHECGETQPRHGFIAPTSSLTL